jgi:hypothetical protein
MWMNPMCLPTRLANTTFTHSHSAVYRLRLQWFSLQMCQAFHSSSIQFSSLCTAFNKHAAPTLCNGSWPDQNGQGSVPSIAHKRRHFLPQEESIAAAAVSVHNGAKQASSVDAAEVLIADALETAKVALEAEKAKANKPSKRLKHKMKKALPCCMRQGGALEDASAGGPACLVLQTPAGRRLHEVVKVLEAALELQPSRQVHALEREAAASKQALDTERKVGHACCQFCACT